jgi:hypothetical protein
MSPFCSLIAAKEGTVTGPWARHLNAHVGLDPLTRRDYPLVKAALVDIDDVLVGHHSLGDLSADFLLRFSECLKLGCDIGVSQGTSSSLGIAYGNCSVGLKVELLPCDLD